MTGGDIGQIAQNMITYFGGQAGGLIIAAALLIVGLLAAAHFVSGRTFVHSLGFGVFAWTAAFMVRQLIGWG